MTPEQWEKVGEIYHKAVELEAEPREAFLDEACGSDATLRNEVESLLRADEEAGNFIAEPIVGNSATRSDSEDSEPKPGELIGHYRFERSIGSGGMGEVYLATDTRLGRKVAIKKLPAEISDDPSFLRRFRNEALAAANINHPNVATIYSVEEAGSKPFITMEYIDGQTLDRAIPFDGLPLETFSDWFAQLADALAFAHHKGVIHRDVKPGNIMIVSGRIPKILDFGLAQIDRRRFEQSDADIHITTPGQVMGTPSYMSPEQAEGKAVDHRSDIFSFGVVMYEALTGRRPFAGDSHAEIVSNLLKSDPAPLESLRPDVPDPFRRVVERCIRKPKSERYQSMREVADSLLALRSLARSGRSFESLQRRLFREARSPSARWMPFAIVLVAIVAFAGWYNFSGQRSSTIALEDLNFRRLSQSNNVAFAAISPDGRSVAYVTYEDNGDRALWLRRVTDPNAIQIVPPQQLLYWDCPIFSNDGEHIYFITAERSALHGTMYRVPTLGGQPKKIVERVNHLGNLSPDGRRVLFVRYGGPDPNRSVNTTDARLMSAGSVDGSDELEHAAVAGESVIREPRFASDGRSVFFVKRELDGGIEFWSISMLDTATGKESLIIRQKERIWEMSEVRRTKSLLMTAIDPGSNRRQLFQVTVPDGKTTRLTNDLNNYIGVSIDREGRNIVTAQRSDESRVWIGNVDDPASMSPITREPLAHQAVDWTPDGRVVYDVYENNRRSIWIADSDGKNAMQLTPSDSDNSEPRVSGDGRQIVFTSRRAGYNQIWRMNIDGSSAVLLADVEGIAQAPRFAADGKTVVFRWFNEGSPPMGQIPIDGGPVAGIDYLPKTLAYYWAMSPDGKYVAYTLSGESAESVMVAVRPLNSDAATKLIDIWPSRIFKWTPDGNSIVYQERQRGENLPAKVFLLNPENPDPKLFVSAEPDDVLDLSFSRDGSRFAIVRMKTITDAVMLSTVGPAQN